MADCTAVAVLCFLESVSVEDDSWLYFTSRTVAIKALGFPFAILTP